MILREKRKERTSGLNVKKGEGQTRRGEQVPAMSLKDPGMLSIAVTSTLR